MVYLLECRRSGMRWRPACWRWPASQQRWSGGLLTMRRRLSLVGHPPASVAPAHQSMTCHAWVHLGHESDRLLRTSTENLYARMLNLRTNLASAQVTSTRTQLLCQQMYCPSKRWMARQKTWRWRIHCMRLKRPCRPAPLRLMCTSSRWAILLVKSLVSPGFSEPEMGPRSVLSGAQQVLVCMPCYALIL